MTVIDITHITQNPLKLPCDCPPSDETLQCGSGMYSYVSVFCDHVAVKIPCETSKTSHSYLSVCNEAAILASIDHHPNITEFYGMEMVAGVPKTYFNRLGTNLRKRIWHIAIGEYTLPPLSDRWEWIIQIVQAISYLHSQGIWHMDISAGNVLIDYPNHFQPPTTLRLCDMGSSYRLGEDWKVPLQGSYGYATCIDDSDNLPSIHQDYYALGCLTYQLLLSSLPFSEILFFDYHPMCAKQNFKARPIVASRCQAQEFANIPDSVPVAVRMLIERCWKGDFVDHQDLLQSFTRTSACVEAEICDPWDQPALGTPYPPIPDDLAKMLEP